MGRLLRQKLNALFAPARPDVGLLRRVLRLQAPARITRARGPTGDDFVPYGGAIDKLEGARDRRFVHAFRCAMLLNGVDLPGLGGMTTAAHTAEDVERATAAVGAALEMLRQEGLG